MQANTKSVIITQYEMKSIRDIQKVSPNLVGNEIET